MGERRACRVINAGRKSLRYRSTRDDDGLREKSRELANQRAGSAIAVCTLCCAERGS